MRSTAFGLLCALLLASCATGADDVAVTTAAPVVDNQVSTTSTSPVETTTTTQATTTTVPTTTTIAGVLIRVSVVEGVVTVNGPTSVPQGEQVTIRVRSDTADELHVHTYDLKTDVEPGKVAQVAFTADIPGVHEVELEQSGTKLLELEVGG